MSRRTQNAMAGTLAMLCAIKRKRLNAKRAGGPAPSLSDEQVLEARRLRDRFGLSPRKMLRHFEIQITPGRLVWMRNILEYRARSSPSKPLDPSII